jgi:hypothetical protein
MAAELRLGDVVRLKKVHPCGGFDWKVVRMGADIGIRCLQCERRVLMSRSTLEKRMKTVVHPQV